MLRPRVGQKKPPRLGNTICYGQELARKKPARLGSTICYCQELARKSHQDSVVRFVTAKRGPERATKTRQYDLLRPRVGQKEPPRLGSTICYGQTWARKSHQDSAIRFVTAKSWPEKATNTLQYDLLRPTARATKTRQLEKATKTRQYNLSRPNVGQTKPPRLGSTICYGQTWARKSQRDSAVRFLLRPRVGQKEPPRLGSTTKRGPERATKTRQYDLLRPRVGQKEPPRLGSTICYSQSWAAIRFVTAKRGPEGATKSWQYDLFRPRMGQKRPPRLGNTICYGQELARRSHQDSTVRFVTANVGQKEPAKLGSTICYGPRKSQQDSAVRFVTAKSCTQDSAVTAKSWPGGATRLGSTIRYGQDSAVRFVTANVGQKQPPRLSSTICYGQELALRFVTAPRVGQKKPPRLGSTICYGQTWARKSHQDSAVRFVTAKRGPEGATKTRPRVGQKEPPRLGSTICYGQELARKSHQDSAVRFVTAKSWPERATNTLQYDFLRPTARATKTRPGKATKTRQYDLSRPNVGQTKPPRLGRTICYGQTWARKSQRDSAVRFVSAKSWPERATKTRQYDLLRPTVGQKEPARLGSTICHGQTWARKSHQDSAVRFVTAKRGPERATKTRQYDLLRPRVGQKEPARLGSTICYGQTWARKSHQDSAVRSVTAKSWLEKATKTRQYDLLRPRAGQKEPPRLGSTISYGQELARKSHQD